MNSQGPTMVSDARGGVVTTGCGRTFVVGRLRQHGLDGPRAVRRVTLQVGCQRYDHDQVWASMTADEARRMAQLLVAQADQVDQAKSAPGR